MVRGRSEYSSSCGTEMWPVREGGLCWEWPLREGPLYLLCEVYEVQESLGFGWYPVSRLELFSIFCRYYNYECAVLSRCVDMLNTGYFTHVTMHSTTSSMFFQVCVQISDEGLTVGLPVSRYIWPWATKHTLFGGCNDMCWQGITSTKYDCVAINYMVDLCTSCHNITWCQLNVIILLLKSHYPRPTTFNMTVKHGKFKQLTITPVSCCVVYMYI